MGHTKSIQRLINQLEHDLADATDAVAAATDGFDELLEHLAKEEKEIA